MSGQFSYTSSGGDAFEMDAQGFYVGAGLPVRSYRWPHLLTANSIANVRMTAREAQLKVSAEFQRVDALQTAADFDVSTLKPGTFTALGEWRQRGFVTGFEPDGITLDGWVSGSLDAVLLDGFWWRTRSVSFVIVEDIDSGAFLDFPHGYEFDYGRGSLVKSVDVDAPAACDVLLTVYGPAVNPYVIVGANRHQVNVAVPEGARLVVDGMMKSITLVSRDGSESSCFPAGVRETGAGGGRYIFEKVPPGTQAVAWDNSFGFDLGWYESRSGLPWTPR